MGKLRATRTDDQRLNRAVVWFLTSLGAWLLWGVYGSIGWRPPHGYPHSVAVVAVDANGLPIDGALLIDVDPDDPTELLQPENRDQTHVYIRTYRAREMAFVVAYRDRSFVSEIPTGFYDRDAVLRYAAKMYAASAPTADPLDEDPIYGVLENAGASSEPWRIAWLYVGWLGLLLVGVWSAIRLVVVAMRVVKHFRRRSRGLCPFCAYSMTDHAGGPCPECGKADAETA